MDRPKFTLNPNAAPFIPCYKRTAETESKEENAGGRAFFSEPATNDGNNEHDKLGSISQSIASSREKLLKSAEDSQAIDYKIPETEDGFHNYETTGLLHDFHDSSQFELEYLSSLFPNLSMESVAEVYHANCGNADEAKVMLEQLEGQDDCFYDLPDDLHVSESGPSGPKDAI